MPKISLYLFITFCISWSIWVPQALARVGIISPVVSLTSPLNLVAVWAPGLAAVVVILVSSGTKGLRDLWARVKVWRVPLQWYSFAICAPWLFWLIAYGVDRLLGIEYGAKNVTALPASFVPVLILFSFPNAFAEELGWRGLLYPDLLNRYSRYRASSLVGICWATWHIPTWIAQGLSITECVSVFISIFLAAFFFSWLYTNTRRSLFLVTIYHASTTLAGYFLPVIPTVTPVVVSIAFFLHIVYSRALKG